jgi:hypothetical protein
MRDLVRARLDAVHALRRARCRWPTSPGRSIRSYGAGSNNTGDAAPSALHPVLRFVNQTLLAWAMRKFKRFAAHKIRASRFLQSIAKTNAALFEHWRIGMTGTFA